MTMGAQTTGAIYNNTDVTLTFGSQTATTTQTNVPITLQVKDIQINPKIAVDASTTATQTIAANNTGSPSNTA